MEVILEMFLDIIRVKGPNYPFVFKNIDKKNHSKKKFKIGLLKTNLWNNTKDFIKKDILDFSKKISKNKNIILEEVDWPEKFYNLHQVHSDIYNKSLSYYFSNEFKKPKLLSKTMKNIIEDGLKIEPKKFVNALEQQILFQDELNSVLNDFDCCITISTASEAVNRGEKRDRRYLFALDYGRYTCNQCSSRICT